MIFIDVVECQKKVWTPSEAKKFYLQSQQRPRGMEEGGGGGADGAVDDDRGDYCCIYDAAGLMR